MTKQQAIAQAQRLADRADKPMAILNLNRFSPLYVIRDWDDRYVTADNLVARVNPSGIPTDGAGNVLLPSYPINDQHALERAARKKD